MIERLKSITMDDERLDNPPCRMMIGISPAPTVRKEIAQQRHGNVPPQFTKALKGRSKSWKPKGGQP